MCPSFVVLLASGTRLAPIAGSLTGVGSVVLGVHSGYRFLHARNNSQRAEAAHGIAWSLQGLAALGKLVAPHTPGWQTAAKSLGIAGGAIQVGLGSYRLITGAKRRDKKRMILGGLDVGAGLCWAASACAIATPVTLAGFAGFTLAHIAYEHRDSLRAAARRLFGGEPRRAKGEGASDQSGQ